MAGLGPSGKPTLVGPIVTADRATIFDPAGRDEVAPLVIADWDLDATITEAGELELQGITKGWGKDAIAAVVGRHVLDFP